MSFVRFKINRLDPKNKEARWIFPPSFPFPDGDRCIISGDLRAGIVIQIRPSGNLKIYTTSDGSKKVRVTANHIRCRSFNACHEHMIHARISDTDSRTVLIDGIDPHVLKSRPTMKTRKRLGFPIGQEEQTKSEEIDPSASDKQVTNLATIRAMKNAIDAGEIYTLPNDVQFFIRID